MTQSIYSKQLIPFGDANDYHTFIARHIYGSSPDFYALASVNQIDSEMYKLSLTNDIENGNLESVVECMVNNRKYYVWRDSLWALAICGNQLAYEYLEEPKSMTHRTPKRVVIYKVCDINGETR